MASLEDFTGSQTTSATLDDFQIVGDLVPVSNKPSNVNLAAHTAALSEDPGSVEANYLRVSSDLDSKGQSEFGKQLQDRAKQMSLTRNRDVLVSILTDPELSEEEKSAAANVYMDERSSLYSLRDIVSTEAIVADSDDETVASENARIDFASAIEEVNASHRQRQAMLNQELAKQDPTLMEMGAGFLELLLPFAEQAITENVLNQARGGDPTAWQEALVTMGSAKETLPEILRRVPYEKRGEITQRVIDAVNENSSIVFPDENDFARVDFLRTSLEEGYYGEVDKWIDNIVSVSELALPFAPAIGRGIKFVREVAGLRAARNLETPVRSAEQIVSETPYAARATDDELMAAEDAAEADAADRALRAQEDASEQRIKDRQATMQADPVRRAEDAAEARREAKRAVQGDTAKLRAMEDAAQRRAEAQRGGGNAARMTDEELAAAERAYEEEVVRKRYVQSDVKPVTLSQNYRNTNPAKARVANQLAGEDKSGQAANALYGTNRTEAVVHDAAGEVQRSDGAVRNKVSMPDAYTKQPQKAAKDRIMDLANDVGAIHLTDTERLATATRVVNDFNNAAGLVTRTEMTVPKVNDIGNTTKIGVTYGPKDNGWSSGRDAVETVKTSLRDYGVDDSDITLLTRSGDDYIPIKAEDATEGGDYLVQVDFDYTMANPDIKNWSDMDVIYNIFDRLPPMNRGRAGSFQRHIVDAHSMLHPTLTLGANVSVDRASQFEKVLIELTKGFSDKYNKLPKQSQIAVENEIKRANKQGRNATDAELKGDAGFGKEEIAAIKNWREVWDTIYWLENRDMVKTLRNRNYKMFVDDSSNTKLFVKELSRNKAKQGSRVYDTQTGEVKTMQKEEISDLYETGGSIGELRSKLTIRDEPVDLVLVKNQPGGPYARRLRDDDTALNYREGYYTVYYQDPKFIDKVTLDTNGNVIKRGAVATAKDTPSATRFQKKMAEEAEENVRYEVRDNRERMRLDNDDNWNLQEANGRISQRLRGERLEDATSPITDEAHNHILGPVDSLQRSARNISSRVAMRDYLETAKERAINQYGHMFPKDKYQRPVFPDHHSKVQSGQTFSKEAADARTTVEYINSLEHGYINQVDEFVKTGFRAMADVAGKRNMGLAERALNFAGEHGGPTKFGRGTAFTLYLALNPLRQLMVQSHQAIQLTALHPRYVTTDLAGDMALVLDYKAGMGFSDKLKNMTGVSIRSDEEFKRMIEAYENSGLSASIDKSNLVRGSLSEIADATSAGGYRRTPAARAVGKVSQGIAISRKAGFDLGEEINVLSAWLTHYDMAKRAKGSDKLSKTELDMVTAKARSYTYNMNRAGEMPYNENFLGMIFQFMQVPHKALLQVTTNRNLTWKQKGTLASWNLAMYGGVPGTAMTVWFSDWLPENKEWREAVLQGMEGYTFNKLATLMYGEDVAIDFSSLAATDQQGLYAFITELWSTDLGKHLAESPSGSLFFGGSARITQFAQTAAEYFHFTEPKDSNPTTLVETVNQFAKMSSGWSNLMKARVALQEGKKVSASNSVSDYEVNTVEAIAAALGLQTLDEARRYWTSNEVYEKRKEFQNDVKEWYKQVKLNVGREGISPDEREYNLRVLNLAAENFKDTPAAMDIVLQQLKYDVENGDDLLFKSVLNAFPWMDPNHAKEVVETMPVDEDKRDIARRTLELMQQYRNEE